MRTFTGSDGRFYRNELCLDTTNGPTLASQELSKMDLNKTEKVLLVQWEKIFKLAKATRNYNPSLTYGLYQIIEELNTSYKDEDNRTIFDYPELNGDIKTLKELIRNYYNEEVVPTLFKYEFLK